MPTHRIADIRTLDHRLSDNNPFLFIRLPWNLDPSPSPMFKIRLEILNPLDPSEMQRHVGGQDRRIQHPFETPRIQGCSMRIRVRRGIGMSWIH